jgi:acyl carrier protein
VTYTVKGAVRSPICQPCTLNNSYIFQIYPSVRGISYESSARKMNKAFGSLVITDPEDRLRSVLLEFFELSADTPLEEIRQQAIAAWDSFAAVQLITDLEQRFSVSFKTEELERLRSYHEIRDALLSRGVRFTTSQVETE